MASLTELRSYLRITATGKTSLKSSEGIRVTLKGTAASRTPSSIAQLAATVDVSVKMPKMVTPNGTEVGETFRPEGGYAQAAVAAIVGDDRDVMDELKKYEYNGDQAKAKAAERKAADEAADRKAAKDAEDAAAKGNGKAKTAAK